MLKNYQNLFEQLSAVEEPKGLYQHIVGSIYQRQRVHLKMRFAFLSIFFLGTLALFAAAFVLLQSAFVESGLTQYFSLIFSDSMTVIASWQDFVFSIVESLPVFAIIGTLVTFFIVFVVLRFLLHDFKLLFLSSFKKFNL